MAWEGGHPPGFDDPLVHGQEALFLAQDCFTSGCHGVDLEGGAALASSLDMAVSHEWPPSSEYDADAINYMIALLDSEPAAYDWGFRYIVRKAPSPTVIGAGGYTGPAKDGSIELKELFDYLSPQVARVARREFNNEQTPQLLGGSELLTRGVRLLE